MVVRQLARDDIPQLIGLLQRWYPEAASDGQGHLLTAAFYEHQVALWEEDADIGNRPFFVWLTVSAGELVSLSYVSCDLASSMMRYELMVTAPEHRAAGILRRLGALTTLIQRSIGVTTAVGMATLRHPYSQRVSERHGCHLTGIGAG